MAKSLRSKWKRKCKAVKRVRYAAKELARLRKTVGADKPQSIDVVMKDVSDLVKVTNAAAIQEQTKKKREPKIPKSKVAIGNKTFDAKTLRDENGAYPVWMHPRKIKKIRTARQKTEKAKRKGKNKGKAKGRVKAKKRAGRQGKGNHKVL